MMGAYISQIVELPEGQVPVIHEQGIPVAHQLGRPLNSVVQERTAHAAARAASSSRVRFEEATSSSRPSPIGTTRMETSVAPASAKAAKRFSMADSLPAASKSPT